MTTIQVKVESPAASSRAKIIRGILTVALVAFFLGYAVRHLSALLDKSPEPAGFVRGLLQGALMPCAMPLLAFGRDVTIYAANNAGVPYKLGYTCGVNACGAIFFGLFFLRLHRWRKRMNGKT
ncbi:MAG: hypothetical protein QOD03_272 [Verrucomicrobiota bacterium]|jgi:hypothetical protein